MLMICENAQQCTCLDCFSKTPHEFNNNCDHTCGHYDENPLKKCIEYKKDLPLTTKKGIKYLLEFFMTNDFKSEDDALDFAEALIDIIPKRRK